MAVGPRAEGVSKYPSKASMIPATTRAAMMRGRRAMLSGVRHAYAAEQSTLPNESTPADGEFTPSEIDGCNHKFRGTLQICETEGKGRGLFASRRFAPDDLVMSARAVVESDVRSSHSVQTDWDEHVVMDLPATLINHSCDANVGIRDNELGAYDFFALTDIVEGEELVWDYNASEWEISTPFQCACSSPRCRGRLRGFKHDGEHIRNAYGPFYASYLKKN